ncbi:hypothetical protein ACHAXS_006945 [Conticribra weissflogii]
MTNNPNCSVPFNIFATVGTTSFDDFIKSLCSIPFILSLSRHLQSRDQQHEHRNSNFNDVATVELVIQYGKGTCPRQFLEGSVNSFRRQDSCPIGILEIQPSEKGEIDDENDETASERAGAEVGSMILRISTPSPLETSIIKGGYQRQLPKPKECDSTSDGTQRMTTNNIRIRWYSFLPSLSRDMQRADLILTHAGAGTLLEALTLSPSREDDMMMTKSLQLEKETMARETSENVVTVTSAEKRKTNLQKEKLTTAPSKIKIINAVINSNLMNNHQTELARELERRRHIRVTYDPVSEWGSEEGADTFWGEIIGGSSSTTSSSMFVPVPFVGGSSFANGNFGYESSRRCVSSFQRIVDRVMGFEDDCDDYDDDDDDEKAGHDDDSGYDNKPWLKVD